MKPSSLHSRLLLVAGIVLLSGCSMTDIGSTLRGDHYLMTGDYRAGEASFRQSVREHPASAGNNYYLGRFLLARNRPKQALPWLEKAVRLDPGNADYHFWLGMALGATGRDKAERKQYKQALAIDPKHLQALIYLGNAELRRGRYTTALTLYQKALRIWPGSPTALYNRALVMKVLGRTPEEKTAWLQYLDRYPSGSLAIRATSHLNRLGDFSYRNHYLGRRTVTLTKIWFRPFTAELDPYSYPALDLVGATVSNMTKGTLQVVVYQKNDRELARQRAISVKKYLQQKYPALKGGRIRISWFDREEIFTADGRKQKSGESVRFFLTGWK